MGVLDEAIREHLDLKRKRGADPGEIERLEREALGPVRREPTAYSLEPPPQQQAAPEGEFAAAQDYQEEPPSEQPRRGFFRRRPKEQHIEPSPARPEGEPEPEREFGDQDTPEYAEPYDQAAAPAGATPPPAPPPLTFDSPPPKRPRFAAEPPESPDAAEPATSELRAEPSQVGSEGPNADPAPGAASSSARGGLNPEELRSDQVEPGATREWDVESAFTNESSSEHEPDPAERASDPAEGEEDDMLGETPDFLQDTPEHDRLWFEQRPPRDFNFDG